MNRQNNIHFVSLTIASMVLVVTTPKTSTAQLDRSGFAAASQAVNTFIDSNAAQLNATYVDLHSHPELSYAEVRTAALVAQHLRQLGYDVAERVGNYGVAGRISYGVVGELKNGEGPRLLIRGDMDGLPIEETTGLPYASRVRVSDGNGGTTSVMHGCGHDVHTTVLLGTAAFLAQHKTLWTGTVVIVAQPAEERGTGAKAMLADGLYERYGRPDYGIALHVDPAMAAGKVGYVSGYMNANADAVDLVVRGTGGHGAYPHATRDPIVIASRIVVALQTIVSREVSPTEAAVISVGSFQGGAKHNVIPDEVHLKLTVRSQKLSVRKQLLDGIARTARGVAIAAGVPQDRMPLVRVVEEEFTPACYNDPEVTERIATVFKRALGQSNVVLFEPMMGAEDFGRFSLPDHSVPTFMYRLGTQAPERLAELKAKGAQPPSLHNGGFAPDPSPTLATGVRAMSIAALELLAQTSGPTSMQERVGSRGPTFRTGKMRSRQEP